MPLHDLAFTKWLVDESKELFEMKAFNSWVAAVVACSAIATQANADVLMAGSVGVSSGAHAEGEVQYSNGVNNVAVKNQQKPNRVHPVFVSGSLINNTNTGAWLMAQSVRRDGAARPQKAEMNLLAGGGQRITPIPPAGTEMRAISSFEQFVQLFTPSSGSHVDSGEFQAMVGDEDEIAPKTSNMTLIGLFTFSLAGITAVISASRRGLFGRTPRQRRARMF